MHYVSFPYNPKNSKLTPAAYHHFNEPFNATWLLEQSFFDGLWTRFHGVGARSANGVGLRAAVNSSVFTVDLSTGLRPSRSAIADAAGDAVDSVSNLSAVPVVWTAQLTPADAAAVSSLTYNASGNAMPMPPTDSDCS